MLEAFQQHINQDFPELLKNRFLLACSGGLDSVALTHLCHKSQMNFALAHCNFGLRGDDSEGDEQFVGSLAQKLGKEFFVTHFDTLGYVNQHKVSVQMAARKLRYHWFNKILEENNLVSLVTAHHADDDLETFLINLSRGTGIDGLTGIPAKTTLLSRPLLKFSREDLLTYAQNNQLEWREDKSNADAKYLRNKIRLEIIPTLKELHSNFLENFMNTQSFLNGTAQIAQHHLQELKKRLFVEEKKVIKISIQQLRELSPQSSYLYGIFNEYGFNESNAIIDLLDAISGKYLVSKTHKLLKDRDFLLLTEIRLNDASQEIYNISQEQKVIQEPLEMKFSIVPKRDNNTDTIIYVDKNALKYPLTIRKWNKGDYFYPFGFHGKKKLAKFFKDEKIDVFSKKEQWLLCSDAEIVWIVGRRADDRFKVQDSTKEVLRIEIV